MEKSAIRLWVLFSSVGLFAFGLFYHISSSEFWPITISKTWWSLPNVELSMLQKPFFSVFLALFHGLPLDDVQHLLLVKLVFTAMGLASIYFLGTSAQNHRTGWNGFAAALLLVLLSPLLRENFFRVRSDQMTVFFLSFALWSKQSKKIIWALLSLTLMLTVSIKSVIFLIPSAFIFYPEIRFFWKTLNQKRRLYLGLSLLAAAIWLLALNISSLRYFTETLQFQQDYGFYYTRYLKSEGMILALSLASGIWLYQRAPYRKNILFSGLMCLVLLVTWPQPLPFFAASLASLIYFPILLIAFDPLFPRKKKTLLLGGGILLQAFSVGILSYQKADLYTSNLPQLAYIEQISRFEQGLGFSYLDGMGILPRQNFNPCFVSVADEVANGNCWNQISSGSADTIITTQRLAFFGVNLFQTIERTYEQIKPNFWVRKDLVQKIDPHEKNLNIETGLPILMFGFD